jgi:threonine dehydratase
MKPGNDSIGDSVLAIEDIHIPTLEDIQQAAKRIAPHAHRTPVLTSRALNRIAGANLFFKCENFQKVGAFKFRGAANAVFSLTDEEARYGVCTHSSGNHAQALALAAATRGIIAYIIMPRNAPAVKRNGVKGYGGEIVLCEPTLKAREETVEEIIRKTGAAFIHPYDDLRVITGQATAAMEMVEEIEGLDTVMTPVGGGGLLSGTALSVHYMSPAVKVIAAEPKAADDAYRSFKSGRFVPSENPRTIADGLLTSLGKITFPLIRQYVHEMVTVSEEEIVRSMRLIWERMKIVVEPSGAVPFGAILENKETFKGKRIGIIISGGNVDLDALPWRS